LHNLYAMLAILRRSMVTAAISGFALGAGSAAGAQTEAVAETKSVANDDELLRKYVRSTLGFEGAVHAALMSTWEQWRNSPPEWGQGPDGYAKRLASDYASSAIGDTTKYAVARLLHHDPSFTRCQCDGFGPRLRHALTSPFTARTRSGRRVLSPAFFAGSLAGRVIPAATWYPARHGALSGLEQTASNVAAKMAINVWKEFRPAQPQ
jgi:hypothetical protein